MRSLTLPQGELGRKRQTELAAAFFNPMTELDKTMASHPWAARAKKLTLKKQPALLAAEIRRLASKEELWIVRKLERQLYDRYCALNDLGDNRTEEQFNEWVSLSEIYQGSNDQALWPVLSIEDLLSLNKITTDAQL